MHIVEVAGTELFLAGPSQVVRVDVESPPGELRVTVAGPGLSGSAVAHSGQPVEVGVSCTAPPGTVVPIRVTVDGPDGRAEADAEIVVAEPGWTVWMVSHFHYDPVWWNTQAAYTAMWDREGR